jgi:hypothetical protein
MSSSKEYILANSRAAKLELLQMRWGVSISERNYIKINSE